MFFLRRNWHCLTLKELYYQYLFPQKNLDKKIFVITFDDGYRSNYLNALPLLKKYNLKATIFLIFNFIGKENYLNWNEIFEMQDYGIEFGSHTISHLKLTKISLPEAKKEIFNSKKFFENRLKREILSFCYPISDFNEKIIGLVKEAGYKLAVVTPCSPEFKESIFTLKRIGISAKDYNLRFLLKTTPIFDFLREIKYRYLS